MNNEKEFPSKGQILDAMNKKLEDLQNEIIWLKEVRRDFINKFIGEEYIKEEDKND